MRDYLDFEKPIRELEEKIEKLASAESPKAGTQDEIRKLRTKLAQVEHELYSSLTPWQRTQLARHPPRPTTLDNIGMPNPEGYRKALRLMRLAEKFNRPIVTFIDTPGAYPGIGAEERGQAEAIARNLLVMSRLSVPIISIVIGEGGSGGALALGVSDRILMLEHSVYSVISPEG